MVVGVVAALVAAVAAVVVARARTLATHKAVRAVRVANTRRPEIQTRSPRASSNSVPNMMKTPNQPVTFLLASHRLVSPQAETEAAFVADGLRAVAAAVADRVAVVVDVLAAVVRAAQGTLAPSVDRH